MSSILFFTLLVMIVAFCVICSLAEAMEADAILRQNVKILRTKVAESRTPDERQYWARVLQDHLRVLQ